MSATIDHPHPQIPNPLPFSRNSGKGEDLDWWALR